MVRKKLLTNFLKKKIMRDTVILQRFQSSDEGTFGVLLAPEFWCYTIEPPWRNNKRSRSCIPAGEYHCHWRKSRRFGWSYAIRKVPDRSSILFHSGNLAGDKNKGMMSDSDGCILPGRRKGTLKHQQAVLQSRDALQAFIGVMGQQDFTLKIESGGTL